jgi:putative SOS response-associated peptidase YedK
MCGRYALYGPRRRSREDNQYLDGLDAFPERYNVAPTDAMPIVRVTDGGVAPVAARWGLVPPWAKDVGIGARYINAVSENLPTNKVFGPPYRRKQRCLVPACGFYEWEMRPDGSKQPYYFTGAEEGLLAFAGLWDVWRQPDGALLQSYTILTVAPNEFVARFHDRMPVVLDARDYERWLLDDDPRDALRACHNEVLINYPVSRQVGNVRNQDATLVAPLESDGQGALF